MSKFKVLVESISDEYAKRKIATDLFFQFRKNPTLSAEQAQQIIDDLIDSDIIINDNLLTAHFDNDNQRRLEVLKLAKAKLYSLSDLVFDDDGRMANKALSDAIYNKIDYIKNEMKALSGSLNQ